MRPAHTALPLNLGCKCHCIVNPFSHIRHTQHLPSGLGYSQYVQRTSLYILPFGYQTLSLQVESSVLEPTCKAYNI